MSNCATRHARHCRLGARGALAGAMELGPLARAARASAPASDPPGEARAAAARQQGLQRFRGQLLQLAGGPHIVAYGLAIRTGYRGLVGEIVLPFRSAQPKLVTEARSTLIVSAIQTLRANGLYESYVDLLSPQLRQDIMALVAGLWIPCELALEHFRTMDRLQLSKSTIEAIGAEVAERGAKTVLTRAPALSRQGDPTPWDMLLTSHRNLDINWRGSDIMVTKEGPHEALFTWAGQPCASVPYFVTSYGGFMRAVLRNYRRPTGTHRIVYEQCTPTTIVIHLSWV